MLRAAWKRAIFVLKKTLGMFIAIFVIAMLIISSFLVALRLDERPRTDDAYLLAYYANIAPEVSGRLFHSTSRTIKASTPEMSFL